MKTFIILVLYILLSSCSGNITTMVQPNINLSHFKKAVIVQSKHSHNLGLELPFQEKVIDDNVKTEPDNSIPLLIKEELIKYNFATTIVKEKSDISYPDLIITYRDIWRWDFKKIIDELEIYLINPEDNKIIASVKYKILSEEFHDFPSPSSIIPDMVKELINKLNYYK